MPDALGWRGKFGVMAPSTNTIVQPDFDDMRPFGVTNHYSRIFTPNAKALSNASFKAGIDTIGSNVMDAIRSLCGRCVVMNSGRKIREGGVSEVLSNPKVVQAYLGAEVAA